MGGLDIKSHQARKEGKFVAGCDEVGRGCLAGPVVAAAVILPKDMPAIRLSDSKSMTKNALVESDALIRRHALTHAVGIVNPRQIDQMNILWASIRAMHMALAKLKFFPDHILVDGNRFKPFENINYDCVVKGDSKFESIAAASIVAKVFRDRLMANLHCLYPNYGWAHNVGYPTIQHRKELDSAGYTPFHRLTFKGVQENGFCLFDK